MAQFKPKSTGTISPKYTTSGDFLAVGDPSRYGHNNYKRTFYLISTGGFSQEAIDAHKNYKNKEDWVGVMGLSKHPEENFSKLHQINEGLIQGVL